MAKCLSPVSIKNLNNEYIQVPCGKCCNCVNNNWQQWIFRNQQELKVSKLGLTVTLTYDDLHCPILNGQGYTVLKRDIQLFIKRLRSKIPPRTFKYMIVSEYGKNFLRPHYHGLLYFNHDCSFERDTIESIIQTSWNMGFIKFDSISSESIAYTTKYLLKDSPQAEFGDPTFMLSSRRPAIGSQYVEDNFEWYNMNMKKSYIQLTGGGKIGLPRFIKDKLRKKRQELVNKCSSVTDLDYILKNDISLQQYYEEKDLKEQEEFEKLRLQGLDPFEHTFNLSAYKIEKFNKKLKAHKNKEKF